MDCLDFLRIVGNSYEKKSALVELYILSQKTGKDEQTILKQAQSIGKDLLMIEDVGIYKNCIGLTKKAWNLLDLSDAVEGFINNIVEDLKKRGMEILSKNRIGLNDLYILLIPTIQFKKNDNEYSLNFFTEGSFSEQFTYKKDFKSLNDEPLLVYFCSGKENCIDNDDYIIIKYAIDMNMNDKGTFNYKFQILDNSQSETIISMESIEDFTNNLLSKI